MRRFLLSCAIVVLVSSGSAFGQIVSNSDCGSEYEAKARPIAAESNAIINSFSSPMSKKDCSTVPRLKVLNRIFSQLCLARASKYSYCGATCHLNYIDWSIYAKTCGGRAVQNASSARQASAASGRLHPAVASASSLRPTSCSDISGLGGSSAPATNCRSGNASLQQARSQQTQNPTAARQSYAKAAAAYRRAGDRAKARAVLQEAAAVAKAAADAAKAASQTPQAAQQAPPSTTVAKLEPSGTPPSQTSGASQAPSAPPPSAAMPRHWMGTADPDDCAAANDLEKNTAAYYDTCVPDPPDDDDKAALRAELQDKLKNRYVPPISPQDLTHRANNACASVRWDGKRQCIDDFKVKTLLADDADVKKVCAEVSDPIKQLHCVDGVYVFGPAKQWDTSYRDSLKPKMGPTKTSDAPQPIDSKAAEADMDTHDGCGRGQGMKPTPGAFGAYSCQPLGTMGMPLMPGTNAGDAKDQADPVAAFEQSVDAVAATVANATVKESNVAEKERPACLSAAYTAARSLLKGGTAPTACGATPEAARVELLRYARAHIETRNPGTEELLAYLGARRAGSAGASASNASTESQSARLTTCMIGGGETQTCATVVAGPQPKGASCTEAAAHWKSSEDIKDLATYEDHLLRFPTCSFAGLAKARIEGFLRR